MKFRLFIFLLLLSCSNQVLDKKAQEAETFFAKGDFEKALEIYTELESKGINNVLIYERMADSTQNIGLKVFYLRKAIRLGCLECEDKLQKARETIKFKPIFRPDSLLTNNLRSSLILASSMILAISIIAFHFIDKKIFLSGFIPSTITLTWLILGTYCKTDFPSEIENCLFRGIVNLDQEAIVIKDNSFALSLKDEKSQAVLSLPKGAEILVTSSDSNLEKDKWAQLKLPNNRVGWIMLENLKLIK